MSDELYIGLMSGTSLDAIDTVLVDFSPATPQLISTHSEPISPQLKQDILYLCFPRENAIDHMGTIDVTLGHLFAKSVMTLIHKAHISPHEVQAIGSHGQTIRHMPNAKFPFTLQIGDPNIIAAHTGITTVADFRRRDMALGGQAAPLVPAFHEYLLRHHNEDRWVVNIGGIANITLLPSDYHEPIIGFDTGPGNTLLDSWCMQHTQKNYDDNGLWARTGQIHTTLLQQLLHDPYFAKPAPKSTGREYFNLTWLEKNLIPLSKNISPKDVQATLTELTAITIADAINHSCMSHGSLWLCGGGSYNSYLMERLEYHRPYIDIKTTAHIGIDPKWIEATAFAWLARQTMNHKPGNIPSVTGASHATVLGGIYLVTQGSN